MYWAAGNYEELAHLPKKARTQFVVLALKNHGREFMRRFYVALACSLIGPLLLSSIEVLQGGLKLLLVLIPSFLFYIYLLWEINGSLHRAVLKQLEAKDQKAP